MEPENVEIEGEFVVLFDNVKSKKVWQDFVVQLSGFAAGHDIRVREHGTEPQMRRSLQKRAEFIAAKHIDVEEDDQAED